MRHEQNTRLLPLSFTTEGSSHSKRISTDAILALTSLLNSFMDVVASLTHDPLPKRYIDRTRVQRLKFMLPPIVPRNLKPRNLILRALSSFSRKFPPTKITRCTVDRFQSNSHCGWFWAWDQDYLRVVTICDSTSNSSLTQIHLLKRVIH